LILPLYIYLLEQVKLLIFETKDISNQNNNQTLEFMEHKKGGKIGLALSGGGYRAAAFHLGTMRKLNELNILNKIDVFSCISGGSLIGAYYCLNSNRPFEEIERDFREKLKKSVTRKLLLVLGFLLLVFIGLLYLLFKLEYAMIAYLTLVLGTLSLFFFTFRILPVSLIIEKIYSQIFYKGKLIKDLPNHPSLLINATNLETGRMWSFSRNKMGDSSYQYRKSGSITFKHDEFPISKAVASSTCVPFAFSPIKIGKKYFTNKEDYSKIIPRLIDGGVYDNQGVHKLTQPASKHKCDTIIVSDAGMKFPSHSIFNNNFTLLMRTSNIFMRRIKNLQFQHNIYYQSSKEDTSIAYLALGWDVELCISGFIDNLKKGHISKKVLTHHGIDDEIIDQVEKIKECLLDSIEYPKIEKQILNFEKKYIARNVSTNLTALSEEKISCLSDHGAVMTEIQIKLYCPFLL